MSVDGHFIFHIIFSSWLKSFVRHGHFFFDVLYFYNIVARIVHVIATFSMSLIVSPGIGN